MIARHVEIIEDNKKLIGFEGYDENSDEDDNESLSSESQKTLNQAFLKNVAKKKILTVKF